jgi:alpha-1,3-rhamnosyl/mannosyltransferase
MVDPRNYEEIANTLAKVLSDTALNNTMEKRGLAQVSKFTWKRCAEKTYAFYKYIIESTQ